MAPQATPRTPAEVGGMGHSLRRKEDPRFVRGKGTYVDDIQLPGMLYLDIVRSPYAHARITSVLGKAGEERVRDALAAAPGSARLELHPSERELVRRLLEFPAEIAEAATRRAPHRIAAYALETAQAFSAFYRDCQVIGAEGEGVEEWRLGLCLLAKRTIAQALGLLGISAPERM